MTLLRLLCPRILASVASDMPLFAARVAKVWRRVVMTHGMPAALRTLTCQFSQRGKLNCFSGLRSLGNR